MFETKDYSILVNQFNNDRNELFSSELAKLMEVDQEQYCGIPLKRVTLKEAFSSTKHIDQHLLNLVNTYGFPTEELVGVKLINDTLIDTNPLYYVLFRHSYQANSKLIDEYLIEAVENGLLKRHILTDLHAVSSFPFLKIDCEIYSERNYEQKGKYIYDLEHLKRTVLFKNTSNNYFVFYAPLVILDGATKREFGNHFTEIFEFVCEAKNCQ